MSRTALIKVKPRRYKIGDIVRIDSVIMHPMHTGLVKDKKTGKIIPPHHINKVEVYYGDQLVTSLDVNASVSANPYFSFNLKIDKKAPLKIIWRDNKGEVTEKVVKIKPQ
ncbi:thiosulfate oxidation carrier complex protein SoxZ [Persephonella sp.]